MANTAITVGSQALAGPGFVPAPSFSQNILNFTFQLGQNTQNAQPTTFAGTSSTQQSFSGLRARVRIGYAAGPTGSTCDAKIFGLPPTVLNQLTAVAAVQPKVSRNNVIISAGKSTTGNASAANANNSPVGGFPVVFGGTIAFSYGDYNQQPEVPLHIIAQAGLSAAVNRAAPASFTGTTSVAQMMRNYAQALGIGFENNGVSAQLTNPYLPGTILQQIYLAAEQSNTMALIVDGGTTLAIWPKGSYRINATSIPLISASTGMIGYPSFAQNGLMAVRMLYNPDVLYGGQIQIQSQISQANGKWVVWSIQHILDSLDPNGDWMTIALCRPVGAAPAIPSPVSQ